jgi:hypothetical protein
VRQLLQPRHHPAAASVSWPHAIASAVLYIRLHRIQHLVLVEFNALSTYWRSPQAHMIMLCKGHGRTMSVKAALPCQ